MIDNAKYNCPCANVRPTSGSSSHSRHAPGGTRLLDSLIRPLRPAPAGMCLGLGLLDALLAGPGVTGALIHVAAVLVVLRYGFMIIEKRAWGSRRDDIHDWASFNQGFEEPLKLIVVLTFLALLHGVATHYGGTPGGYAVLLAANLAAPAAVLIIGLDGSLVNALNPGRIMALISRLGFDYAAACFVLALFSMAGNIALDILLAAAPRSLRVLVYGFCSFYYILAVFFMLGWLVGRHRVRLID